MLLHLAQASAPPPKLGAVNFSSVFFFVLFAAITLTITWFAARRTKNAATFYTAGGGITGLQNGLALAGDYMSAASFLGIVGMVAKSGFDGLIYSIGFLVGWPVVMFLIAEPLRNLGKYTFADVVALRLRQRPVRAAATVGTLSVIVFYLIAQMVGAGLLIKLLFGLSYHLAVVIVGVVMLAYVFFGGMVATTWVQITKAVLLLGGALLMGILVLSKFGFNPLALFAAAAAKARESNATLNVLAPGSFIPTAWDAISLALALMFGTAGLPHILMRFFTVPDAKTARSSVSYATTFIGFFYLLTFVLGFGALTMVGKETITNYDSGGNMAAPLLARVLGGDPFLGFIAAVAFATILAVVSGLTLSGAAALSHDFWVNVIKRGEADEAEQFRIARIATIILGVVAIALGMLFEKQNIAYMVGLAFAIAASSNFPALLLAILWKPFTSKGAVACMLVGSLTAVGLIALSPTIMVDVLKQSKAIFPLKNPAIVSLPLAFVAGIVVSLMAPEPKAAEQFEGMQRRMNLGNDVAKVSH
ncbi:cation/acetate symporter ActP [Candidatus Sumerlaeota bacterium]|nr:cation/acetate symporter ActP [Candidatus Sumerlaeota bacterium]